MLDPFPPMILPIQMLQLHDNKNVNKLQYDTYMEEIRNNRCHRYHK